MKLKIMKPNGIVLVGLTGGIATGKTTFANELRKFGAKVINADRIAHIVTVPYRQVWKDIVRAFGKEILNINSSINRERLAKIIFEKPAKKKVLERITHLAITKEINRRIQYYAKKHTKPIVVLDAPLLFEAGLNGFMDINIVVWTPQRTQLERLIKRDGYNEQEALQRIASQMPLETKKKLADYSVNNSNKKSELRKQAKELWNKILP